MLSGCVVLLVGQSRCQSILVWRWPALCVCEQGLPTCEGVSSVASHEVCVCSSCVYITFVVGWLHKNGYLGMHVTAV